ncbi:hypothetical protein HHI36_022497 [Cryptolaemus montrouzieri]|uniref:Uncharacterized protein n=1 Tax=Cryptolaemus montrouzieri TaxID=559131 RepID=A0ABD2N019_9CUCU
MGKRNKLHPKCIHSSQINLGLDKKSKAKNIKTKISSNRMTMLPGFLSHGVKSEVAKKEEEISENRQCILGEDLHSLFNNDNGCKTERSVRRSTRISQKNPIKLSSKRIRSLKRKKLKVQDISVSEQDLQQSFNSDPEHALLAEKKKPKTSKSLLKKIISTNSFYQSSPFFKFIFSNKKTETSHFNQNLLNKIQFKVDVKQNIRNKIFEEIAKVNDILSGKIDPATVMGNFKKLPYDDCDVDLKIPEYLFPSREWKYATPPSQKLNLTVYEESAIRPAIFCNDGTGRNIYELRKDMDANLISKVNTKCIEVDNRYMQEIANFDKENRPLEDYCHRQRSRDYNRTEKFNQEKVNQYLYELSATIHARPKKTVKRLRFAESFSKNEPNVREQGYCRASTSAFPDGDVSDSTDVDFSIFNCLTDNCEIPQTPFKMSRNVNIFKHFGIENGLL